VNVVNNGVQEKKFWF